MAPNQGGSHVNGSLLIRDVEVQAAACCEGCHQGLQLRGGGAFDQAVHQRCSRSSDRGRARLLMWQRRVWGTVATAGWGCCGQHKSNTRPGPAASN